MPQREAEIKILNRRSDRLKKRRNQRMVKLTDDHQYVVDECTVKIVTIDRTQIKGVVNKKGSRAGIRSVYQSTIRLSSLFIRQSQKAMKTKFSQLTRIRSFGQSWKMMVIHNGGSSPAEVRKI